VIDIHGRQESVDIIYWSLRPSTIWTLFVRLYQPAKVGSEETGSDKN